MSITVDQSSPLSPTSLEEPFAFAPGGLSDHELIEAMTAARRSASRAQAVELAAVAELARRRFAEAAERDRVVEVLSPADYVFDEVAEALRLTSASADQLIHFATELTERLPGTFAALAAGEIDYLRARTLWHGIGQLDDELTRTIEAEMLAKAPEQTSGQIRAKIRRLVRRLAPEAAERRRVEAQERRRIVLVETDDGTAELSGADLPADAASAAYGRVAAIATGLKRDGDARGIDELRADVFLGLLRGTFTPGEPPADTTDRLTPARRSAEPGWTAVDDAIADVIADAARTGLTTLIRAIDTTRPIGSGARADGPPAAGARARGERHHDIGELIAQAGARINRSLNELRNRWCVPGPAPGRDAGPAALPGAAVGRESGPKSGAVVGRETRPANGAVVGRETGPANGAALGRGTGPVDDAAAGLLRGDEARLHGASGYRPPAAMRRLIEHRDRRCCFPGCRRPVRHCDADHSIPHHRGGATCPCNLAMLCRRHHRLKATKGWRLEHLWPGVILWITPTGQWRITAPADRE